MRARIMEGDVYVWYPASSTMNISTLIFMEEEEGCKVKQPGQSTWANPRHRIGYL